MSAFQISEYFAKLPSVPLNNLGWNEITLLQDELFFRLQHEKQGRVDHLREVFAGRRQLKLLITSRNLRNLSARLPTVSVEHLPADFLQDDSPEAIETKCAQLEGAIVLLTNGDVQSAVEKSCYMQLFTRCTSTLFFGWDWDNHHGLMFSFMLAAHSDIYLPAHRDNQYALSRYNPIIQESACGVSQWSRAFLADREDALAHAARSNEPLGKHVMYTPFKYRNGLVATLNPYFPSIGFSEKYNDLTPEQRFAEWHGHKVHWIAPVLNDLPIRTFDALVTGGIPLIPQSLMFSEWLADAHPDDIVAYSARDIMDPRPFVERACYLFDKGGRDGIVRRHRYALQRHHCDLRIEAFLKTAAPVFGYYIG